MKIKHMIWFTIGCFILSTNNDPFIFNGQDLLGWLIFLYTGYKWIISFEFKTFLNELF